VKLIVPEVVQTSAMDCGPASLKCLLEGFGIPASYGRLREACQTDVDGTSIDTLEEVAVKLGLEAEQVMLPIDHLLDPGTAALPAIVVVRLPNGFTHFVVAWRQHGPLIQLMDPGTGRRFVSRAAFLRDVFVHEMLAPAAAWFEWAGGNEFLGVLARRLERIGVASKPLVESARRSGTWLALSALDAATRMTTQLCRAGAIARGGEARRLIEETSARAIADPSTMPDTYWSARPAPPDDEGAEQVRLRGAVLCKVSGTKPAARESLSPDLRAALDEPPARPGRALVAMLRQDGFLRPAVLAGGAVLAAGGAVLQALFFRGLFDVGRQLGLFQQRLGALAALLAFLGAFLCVELPLFFGVAGLGRRLEARLRMAFLAKIPRLGDRYFSSRPTSDMAERSHTVHALRSLPQVALQLISSSAELVITTLGLAWLDPRHALVAVTAGLAGVALPLLTLPPVTERDLRVRVHTGSLMRFYLDALLGLIPVRAHGGERPVRREHEALLVDWAGASRSLVRATVWVEGVQALIGLLLAAWLLVTYLDRSANAGGALLLVYWALNLPNLGQDIALAARQYPLLRNLALRLFEPLGAREEGDATAPAPEHRPSSDGAAVTIDQVSLRLGGHRVLEDVSLELAPGSHVAIVGPSGAGKSSLVGLLLGWYRAEGGRLLVDGAPLEGAHLAAIRRETAWIDPAVQLWNRPLVENLQYGTRGAMPLDLVVDSAELRRVLELLPEGLQTPLGEGGGLVSGGEGQRVRFGRALMRRDARLVILDEPFRGLDRERRRALYARARLWWPNATLLCVTHDVGETRDFPRVLVVEDGRVVEDDAPPELLTRPSRYRALVEAETQVRVELWRRSGFRRLTLADGRLAEGGDGETT
jgi:ATP-binding cassette subfamily B protein